MEEKEPLPPLLFPAIFLSSFSALSYELLLTRIFSVTLWYHLAFMVVAVAMFGLGVGGISAFFLQNKPLIKTSNQILSDTECLKALSICLFCAVYFKIPYVPDRVVLPSIYSAGILASIFFLTAIPFILTGLLNGIIFKRYSSRIGTIYFADLAGASAGAICGTFSLYLTDGITALLLTSLISVVSSLLFLKNRKAITTKPVSAVLLTVLAVITMQITGVRRIRITYAKKYKETKIYYEKWSPIARVTVIDFPLLAWGLGSHYHHPLPAVSYLIEQDGAAGTPIIPLKIVKNPDWLDWDAPSFGFWILKPSSVLIIGSGAGKDIIAAKRAGVKEIFACELNRDIVDIVEEKFAWLSAKPYSFKGVKTIIAEGRNFLMRSDRKYDMIQLAMVDSWAATSAGAYVMSENHLYTIEAFVSYLRHINTSGGFTLSRYFKGFFPSETLRAFATSAEALRREGIKQPSRHLILVKAGDISTIVVKKSPFTAEELKNAKEEARKKGYHILFLPGVKNTSSSIWSELASSTYPSKLLKNFPIDITPTTDDRPFFFFVLKPQIWLMKKFHGKTWNIALPQNIGATIILRNILVSSLLFTAVIFLLPILFTIRIKGRKKKKSTASTISFGFYFFATSTGFMFIEIPILQKFILPFGIPAHATATTLFTILLFAGAGSYIWTSACKTRLLPVVVKICISVSALATIYFFLLTPLTYKLLPLSLPTKMVASSLTIGAIAILMGGTFPLGIKASTRQSSHLIPWMWSISASSSIAGSVGAMVIGIIIGFSYCFIFGAVFYLAGAISIAIYRRKSEVNL